MSETKSDSAPQPATPGVKETPTLILGAGPAGLTAGYLLAKQGLERVGADGDVFDPTLHDAVLHESGDEDVQTVAQVLRAGWRWRGKVLRPAMVKVVGG